MPHKLFDTIKAQFGSINEARMTCLQNPEQIIAFLLRHAKEEYFTQIEGSLIFEKEKFLSLLNSRLLDSSYTRYANKIGLSDEVGSYLLQNSKVVLHFPYKDCVFKGTQSSDKQKGKEIFFNEVIAHDDIDRLFEAKVLCNFQFIESSFTPPPPPIVCQRVEVRFKTA
ncbi:site-specific DNA-methyltransferase [Helicobacter didelphidarum]|nr:site-specific DNA-methyltransferase [Helicobacter didelphidarum]